jgi:hypothetical protein
VQTVGAFFASFATSSYLAPDKLKESMSPGTFLLYNVILILVETAAFLLYEYLLLRKRIRLGEYKDLPVPPKAR